MKENYIKNLNLRRASNSDKRQNENGRDDKHIGTMLPSLLR